MVEHGRSMVGAGSEHGRSMVGVWSEHGRCMVGAWSDLILYFIIFRVELDTIARFTIMVRKCYRDIPYHNWAHAFSVSHSIYILLRKNENLSPFEVKHYENEHREPKLRFCVKCIFLLCIVLSMRF